ncbi:adenylate/guanylate cyclase domain-containing protein [Futiania mangrovi]|uniref:Guanylate cyclase domain-containing protein n=1 Tax=Futiania mangrovi TaxID=2959716 RepID=A0A9J6PG03_9PROT|nr:adenylate/guanylate cyclase domain-containing protein [Futiania mangrovii]MCP1335543.1 hypothetical protein [Futiania mangrovii]
MERRLAAILCADIVGFSRLVARDEVGTVRLVLRLTDDVLKPLIARYRGRLFKTMGDGFLVEFGSAINAVACAQAWQTRGLMPETPKPLSFRIGLHVGDVLVEGEDLLGDGVNVAARLESIAPAGGIAVSGDFASQIRGKSDIHLTSLGIRELKNIERPVEVWVSAFSDTDLAGEGGPTDPVHAPPPAVDRREGASVAVLPFATRSPDPADRYLGEGIADQLVTTLGQVPWFFVTSETASFAETLRGLAPSEIGRKLGVRYLVDGNLQKAGPRLRVTVRLVEAATGRQIWSERFAGSLEEIFDLQDNIARSVIGQVEPRLRRVEIQRSAARHGTPTAYDFYLQAQPLIRSMTPADHERAFALLEAALRCNPEHAAAHGLVAWLMTLRLPQGQGVDHEAGIHHAERAIAAGPHDSEALSTGGYALGFLRRDPDLGLAHLRDALALNPNAARIHDFAGWLQLYAGRPGEALDHFEQSMELSPIDEFAFRALTGLAFSQLGLGRPAEAVEHAKRARSANPNFTVCHRVLAPALIAVGDQHAAEDVVADLRARHPALTVARFAEETRFRDPDFRLLLFAGLAQAGLPTDGWTPPRG